MKPTARVTAEFQSPAEQLFQAWLKPALISQWMFGPALREETIVHIKTEPHVGGRFSFLVERQGQRLDHVGQYLVIEAPSQLHFTWAIGEITPDDSVVRIEIKSTEDGCFLTLDHEMHRDWANYVDRCRDGWAKMLGELNTVLSLDGSSKS